jgi:ABC-type nitrate/sulfonate/bicarbonate transport system substrate-binding protein
MRRCFAYIFLLLFGFFLHPSAHAADKIRIGFPDLAAPFVPLAVGDKRGFFQEEGIVAESIRMNPGVALQALVGGEIDYYTVLGPGVAAAIRGVPVKLVAAYVPVSPTALIARPEISLSSNSRAKP